MQRFFKAGLAAKGLLLIVIPCILQVIFLVGLALIQVETECEPIRARQDREQQMVINRFSIANQKLISELDSCLLERHEMGAPCLKAKEEMTNAAKRLLPVLRSFADDRAPVAGFAGLPENLTPMSQLMEAEARNIELITAASVKAYDDMAAFFAGAAPNPAEDRFAAAIAGPAGFSWYMAAAHLRNVSGQKALATNTYNHPDRICLKVLEVLMVFSVVNLLLLLATVFRFLKDARERLKVILENSNRFASEQLLNPPLGGHDELALVDRSFHEMAEALTRNNREQTSIIDNARDLICTVAAEGKIMAANSAAKNILGIAARDLIGRCLIDFVVVEDKHPTLNKLLSLAQGKSDVPPFETRLVMKNGEIVDVLCSAVWSEEAQAAFCVLHDITHKKMAARLQREAVEVACHQMKEPILFISQFNEALSCSKYGPLKDGADRLVGSVRSSTDRMLTLVRDLEDCEMLDAGVVHLELAWFNVAELLEETVAALEQPAKQCAVTVVAEPTTLRLYADRNRLLQVAVNLTTNALKFSQKESVITLSARTAGNGVQIMVADQGCGIPPDAIASIFERFSQVRQSDAKVKGGSGLGLAICKSLVELHGGSIKVESEEQKGSIFSFTIPNESFRSNRR